MHSKDKSETVNSDEEQIESTDETVQKVPWYKQKKCIIMMILIVILLFFNFNYTIVMVVGPSMEPSYYDANLVIGQRNYQYLQRFDVVVIYSEVAQKTLIKRVIGLPGETIEYKDGYLYINGELIEDRYNYGGTNDFCVTLDNESYYCLGDNRTNSADSRSYGDFDEDEIFAKIQGKQHISVADIRNKFDSSTNN